MADTQPRRPGRPRKYDEGTVSVSCRLTAELEQRDRATIVTCDHDAAWVYRWSRGIRWTANRLPATRPAWAGFLTCQRYRRKRDAPKLFNGLQNPRVE